MSTISKTTSDFLTGINNSQYDPDGTGFNMYSYAYLKKGTDGFSVLNDNKPAVESLADFPVPAHANITLIEASEGPYIGTVGSEYFALTDCSGFVIYIIAQTDASALSILLDGVKNGESHDQPWPSAAQYANYKGDGTTWTQVVDANGVADFANMEKGDIIAWDEVPGTSSDTGHVMIVNGKPTSVGDGFNVEICDSTVLAHANDKRKGVEKGKDITGVGTGTIGLQWTKDGGYQSNFFPGADKWYSHPHINILRLNS